MGTSTASSADGTRPTRVIIIDDHEISRAACRALLRAEGIDVTADLRASDQALTAARTLRPDVAIVDVTPAAEAGFGIASGLRALPAPPAVILTSSTERTQFGARLNGLRFIAKADICAAAIARLTTTPMQADRNRGILALPPNTPAKGMSGLTQTGTFRPATPQKTGEPDDHGIALATDNLRAALPPDGTR